MTNERSGSQTFSIRGTLFFKGWEEAATSLGAAAHALVTTELTQMF